jgi:predicted TIM-barrel fold metal-dependent hydrolase
LFADNLEHEDFMPFTHQKRPTFSRRTFVKSTLLPIAFPIAGLTKSVAESGEQAANAGQTGPDIVDTNVHVFEWPFRKLKYDRTEALVAKLRKHRITQAWAGSFEAVLHKQLDAINRRLAEECRTQGSRVLVPIGSVNPVWPDWQEDIERCHSQYQMPGVRLYPGYHGYTLAHPEFVRLLDEAAKRKMFVQIAIRLEDIRVHHFATAVVDVSVSPLADSLKKVPEAKVQLINAGGGQLGNQVETLVRDTKVTFDIAATEGNGGVGRLIDGKNPSYRGAIPVDRLLFGSHAPYFPCESAVMKLFESPLSREQLEKIMNANARALIA